MFGESGRHAEERPILLVPYSWIGDFVRCHSVVKVANSRWPGRPIDVLATALCAPLADYMPGVRRTIVWDLPRGRLAPSDQWRLAQRLRIEDYGTALIMSRKWKAALAPFLAGIPERVGMVGEARFGLINDLRWGEKKLPRMIDRCAVVALPKDADVPADWRLPELIVPPEEIERWRRRTGIAGSGHAVVALCPGAVGPGKRWPERNYAELARQLAADGLDIWVVGGPDEKASAEIISAGGKFAVDRTATDLRDAILALAAADAAIANDSGLLHVAAAMGKPTIGLFGPTSPALWAPLNPLAATLEAPRPMGATAGSADGRQCRIDDIPVNNVLEATRTIIAGLR